MRPPTTINVLQHNGFTAITRTKKYGLINGTYKWIYEESGTLWRPSAVLKGSTIGTLSGYDEDSFYQRNNNVTMAKYKVPGYGYRVAVWFDNVTGERIA